MDAKILKAAVSAAIKVTLSTTLIGCGGSVTRNAGAAGTDSAGSPTTPSSQSSAGASSAGASSAGAGSAGASSAGASSADAGSSGEASGGAPEATCGGAEVDGCFALLTEATISQPLPEVTRACCQTVLVSMSNGELGFECQNSLETRFMQAPVRSVCCNDPETWHLYPACAPWGPPVPPELTLATLREWEAA